MGDTELEVKSCWGRCPRDRAEVPNDFRNGKFVIVLLKPGLEDPQLCVSEPQHPRQPKPEEENEAGRGDAVFREGSAALWAVWDATDAGWAGMGNIQHQVRG